MGLCRADTALDSGPLLTEDADYVAYEMVCSSGTSAATLSVYRDDGTTLRWHGVSAGLAYAGTWGPNGFNPLTGADLTSGLQTSALVPRRMRVQGTACGSSNTLRILVWQRGRIPGTFAYQTVLGTKVAFSLSQTGTASGRVVVFAR